MLLITSERPTSTSGTPLVSRSQFSFSLVNSWANWGASAVLDIFTAWNSVASPVVTAATAAAQPQRAAN